MSSAIYSQYLSGFFAVLVMSFCWLVPVTSWGDETDLFIDRRPLEMELFVDLSDLCRKQDKSKCQDMAAELNWSVDEVSSKLISLNVRTRGKFRLRRDTCIVPPLFLIFSPEVTEGTLFAGQKLLPLTTHCKAGRINSEDIVLKEYLAYRIYEALTEKSVRARLAHIRYGKPKTRKLSPPHYGFLSEHFESVAARNGLELREAGRFKLSQADAMAMATMELFQYMIGNTDFSALKLHNVVLLRNPQGGVIPLPFDFDFSGLVDADYASPPRKLPISNVRQRLYRGFCHNNLDWDELFSLFQNRKQQIFDVIESVPGLTMMSLKRARRYIRDFYRVLDSDEKRQKRIVEACRMPKD